MGLFKKKKKAEDAPQAEHWPKPRNQDILSETQDLDPERLANKFANIAEALSAPLPEPEIPKPAEEPEEAEPTEEEQQKQKDRSLYNSLLSGLYDAVLILDEKGTVIGSNHRCEEFFGYSCSEMWGMEIDKLISNMSQRVLTKIKQHAETGRFTVVNTACLRKDETTFPAEIAISHIHLLHEGDFIFSIRNHERRNKAKQRQEIQRDALLNAGAGIAMCNSEGIIEYANPAFLKLLLLDEEKDVMQHFIGDYCQSIDAANALVKIPSENAAWFGKVEIITQRETVREVLATSNVAVRKGKNGPERHLVITFMPLPQATSV